MQTVDNDLALKIYIKARATPKVVAAFAERREFDKILIYSKQVIFFIKFSRITKLLVLIFTVIVSFVSFFTTTFVMPFFSVYLMKVGYTPDYMFLLQTILRTDPQVRRFCLNDHLIEFHL